MSDAPDLTLRLEAIRRRFDAVQVALRTNTLNVFNLAHHASWGDVEFLLDTVVSMRPRLQEARSADVTLQLADDVNRLQSELREAEASAEALSATLEQTVDTAARTVQDLSETIATLTRERDEAKEAVSVAERAAGTLGKRVQALTAELDVLDNLYRIEQRLLAEARAALRERHVAGINQAIRAAGVVWRACYGCDLNWPFPSGHDPMSTREWRCPVCCSAELSASARTAAVFPGRTE